MSILNSHPTFPLNNTRIILKPWENKMSQNNNNSSRKRFQDEQIRYLERMFEEEARPELHMKQQLANRLGLLPRQVAIWFQNKRARSKTRQLEQECSLLKANYDDLASKFEALKKDNHSLHLQVQRLRQLSEEYDGIKDIKLETSIVSKDLVTRDYVGKGDYLEEEEGRIWDHETQGIDGCFSFLSDNPPQPQSGYSKCWWEL